MTDISMTNITLADLQESVLDRSAFRTLSEYRQLCSAYTEFVVQSQPTRIVSPSHTNYIFYQYGPDYGHKITRPLNRDLYIETPNEFDEAFDRFSRFLTDLKEHQEKVTEQPGRAEYIGSNEINRVVYTVQQALGCVADSFENSNQARKRIGTLFETLIKIIIREVGLVCEPRTIKLPIPDHPGYTMPYELDLVFSRNKAILAAETDELAQEEPIEEPEYPSPASKASYIEQNEIVGSVKTTSKDRIDKIFLDKYLLTKLLGRDIPVIAIFLHDVQRARKGSSIFGIAPTFKKNHFLGYTIALNRLDGVYYVDPRPDMVNDPQLREQIKDFQQFLVHDLWTL